MIKCNIRALGVLILALPITILVTSCSKHDDPKPEEQTTPAQLLAVATANQIHGIDSLSSFAPYLEDLKLDEADASTGITVFAPVNTAFARQSARLAAPHPGELRETLPDASEIEDYIAKGIIKYSDLTDGKVLTMLSGITLTVTVDDGVIKISGVVLTNEGITDSSKTVIYTLAGLLKKSPSLTITVMDALGWAPGAPQGAPANGATVSLYHSQKDFAEGKTPAYTAETDADGKAAFGEVVPGTYFIEAEKGDESNIMNRSGYWSGAPVDGGVYTGYAIQSIFQSQEEISASGYGVSAAPGDFRFRDANGDGIIQSADFVALPADHITANQGQKSAVTVLIGYPTNNYSLRVRVSDASGWTPENAGGLPAEGATVSLYSSREDYATAEAPAYTAQTGTDGLAKFDKIPSGVYYFVVEKSGKSNILKKAGYWSGTPVDGVYTGLRAVSIFQTQEEINKAAVLPGVTTVPGDLRFLDANRDGIISQNDYVMLPADTTQMAGGTNRYISVLIGSGK